MAGAQCSACGDCCDPVWYPLGAADIRQSASTTGAADLVFAAEHWHPTGARSPDGLHAYSCDRFDARTRLCTAHDERPPICRGYPWYDDDERVPAGADSTVAGPTTTGGRRALPVVLPARCAFRADLPAPPPADLPAPPPADHGETRLMSPF